MRRPTRRWVAFWGTVGAAAVSLAPVGAVPAQAAALHTLVNPGFSSGTAGWAESTPLGSITTIGTGLTGRAARLTHRSSTAYTVVLNDVTDTVRRTVAGASYTATAWVRADRPTTVSIRLQERSNTLRGEGIATVQVGASWQQLGINYVARTTGASMDLNVLGARLAPGGFLDVDELGFAGRTLVWRDDFSASRLDATSWTPLNYSTNGVSNGQLDCLVNRNANLALSRGTLSIIARRESTPIRCGNDPNFPNGRSYTSGFITTKGKKSWTYGRFEIRARLPMARGTTNGLWPAFWMWPNDNASGELDIMEALGREPDRVYHFAHSSTDPAAPSEGGPYVFRGGRTPGDGFHTYAAEWDPGQIRWFVDGRLTYSLTPANAPWVGAAFDSPMHLMVNLSVGGLWAQSPDANTRFPAAYVVDYVRVYGRAR
ncbi:MAG: family 16 glycosylhydrolase [Kineosporiaceae bacterium]